MRTNGRKKNSARKESGASHNSSRPIQRGGEASHERAEARGRAGSLIALLEHRVRPGLDPGISILRDLVRRKRGGLPGMLRVLDKLRRQRDVGKHREDEHLGWHIGLELLAKHEVDELLREGKLVGAFEDAHELDLPETGIGAQ